MQSSSIRAEGFRRPRVQLFLSIPDSAALVVVLVLVQVPAAAEVWGAVVAAEAAVAAWVEVWEEVWVWELRQHPHPQRQPHLYGRGMRRYKPWKVR